MSTPLEIFEVSPSENFMEGNPYRALLAVSEDYVYADARISPPIQLNDMAISMTCDGEKPLHDVVHDQVISTASATCISLYLRTGENADGTEITFEEAKAVYANIVSSLLDKVGAIENEELFKKRGI